MKTIESVFEAYEMPRNRKQQRDAIRYGGRVIAYDLTRPGTGARMQSVNMILVKMADGHFYEYHISFFDRDKEGNINNLKVRQVSEHEALYFASHAYIAFDERGDWTEDRAAILASIAAPGA
jgi:hypothetical protein